MKRYICDTDLEWNDDKLFNGILETSLQAAVIPNNSSIACLCNGCVYLFFKFVMTMIS